MKDCAICGHASEASAPTCPKCGEGSWLAPRAAPPLPAPTDTAPVSGSGENPTAAAPFASRRRRS